MNLYLLPLSSPLHDKTLLNKALLPFFLAMQTDMELTCLSLEDRDDTPLPSTPNIIETWPPTWRNSSRPLPDLRPVRLSVRPVRLSVRPVRKTTRPT